MAHFANGAESVTKREPSSSQPPLQTGLALAEPCKTNKIKVDSREATIFGESDKLYVGETIYVDMSGVAKSSLSRWGTLNKALPDPSLHYVPFTFPRNAMLKTQLTLICEYNITHTVSWDVLNKSYLHDPNPQSGQSTGFGRNYYFQTMKAGLYIPAMSTMQEKSYWDAVSSPRPVGQIGEYDGNGLIIKNWYGMYTRSDELAVGDKQVTVRGYDFARGGTGIDSVVKSKFIGCVHSFSSSLRKMFTWTARGSTLTAAQ